MRLFSKQVFVFFDKNKRFIIGTMLCPLCSIIVQSRFSSQNSTLWQKKVMLIIRKFQESFRQRSVWSVKSFESKVQQSAPEVSACFYNRRRGVGAVLLTSFRFHLAHKFSLTSKSSMSFKKHEVWEIAPWLMAWSNAKSNHHMWAPMMKYQPACCVVSQSSPYLEAQHQCTTYKSVCFQLRSVQSLTKHHAVFFHHKMQTRRISVLFTGRALQRHVAPFNADGHGSLWSRRPLLFLLSSDLFVVTIQLLLGSLKQWRKHFRMRSHEEEKHCNCTMFFFFFFFFFFCVFLGANAPQE